MDQKDQTNGGKTLITLTPTWAYMAQVMTEALVNGTAEGSIRAREEIVRMGERLDELKTYVEKKDKEVDDLFDDLDEARESGSRFEKSFGEALKELAKVDDAGFGSIDEALKTIVELKRQLTARVDHKDDLDKAKDYIADLEGQLAMKDQEIENLNEFRSEQIKYYNERNILREGTPKVRNEEPIHDELVDFLHASEFGRKHNLDEEAEDLVAVREFVIYTLNRNAKHREENAKLEEVGE